jgi:ABC-2 type transport system permease protein
MQGFQLIMNFLVMPLFFLSGAIFPLQKGVPDLLLTIARVDPLAYGVDGLRDTLSGISHFGLHVDFIILVAITALLLAIGSYLFSKIQI